MFKWIMWLLKWIGRIFKLIAWVFKRTARIIIVLLLVGSLALNVAILTIAPVALLASNIIESVIDYIPITSIKGTKPVYSQLKTRNSELAKKNSTLKADIEVKKKTITTANDTIAKQSDELAKLSGKVKNREASIAKKLATLSLRRNELNDANETIEKLTRLSGNNPVKYRGKIKPALDAINDTSIRIFRRTAVRVSRDVGSLAGQSIPYIGIAALVAATAWDLKDSCDTITDIQELEKAFGIPSDNADKICGIKTPTATEVWQSVKESPGAAWKKATELITDLPDFSTTWGATKEFIPDLPDFSSVWEKTKELLNPTKWWDWIKDESDN